MKDTQKKTTYNAIDCFVIVVLSIVSLHVRLWKLGFPNTIVFDEVYFGNFSNSYLNESFYSDIHPPFGKMTMAAIAWLTQYPGQINWGKKLGNDYTRDEINYVSLRLTPGVFSSFCPVLLYCSMRNLFFSIPTSIATAVLIIFDFTTITEGKFILSDSMLHFFTCLHIFAFTFFLQDGTFLRTLFAGITMGIAGSCKLTALGLVALDGITQIIWVFAELPKLTKIIGRALTLLVPLFVIFVSSWIVHFDILKYKDWTGAFQESIFAPYLFTRKEMNRTYPGTRLIGRNIFKQIIKDGIETHKSNMRITTPHPWSSMPQNWPLLMDKYVMFWIGDQAEIKCFGNPITYYLTTLGIALTPVLLLFRRLDKRILVPFIGWFVSYVPFVIVPREMYLYHYIVPLFFAAMNLPAIVETATRGNQKKIRKFTRYIIILSVLCWIYFSPWVYGTKCPNCQERLLLNPRWQLGPPEPLHNYGEDALKTKLIKGTIPIM